MRRRQRPGLTGTWSIGHKHTIYTIDRNVSTVNRSTANTKVNSGMSKFHMYEHIIQAKNNNTIDSTLQPAPKATGSRVFNQTQTCDCQSVILVKGHHYLHTLNWTRDSLSLSKNTISSAACDLRDNARTIKCSLIILIYKPRKDCIFKQRCCFVDFLMGWIEFRANIFISIRWHFILSTS